MTFAAAETFSKPATRGVGTEGHRREQWSEDIPEVAKAIEKRLVRAVESNEMLADRFQAFSKDMDATIGSQVTHSDLVSMVAQHVITMPVLETLFEDGTFGDTNPISKALNRLLDELGSQDVCLEDETVELRGFYASLKSNLNAASSSDARLGVMLEVYEAFFKKAIPKEVRRFGITYTPLEIVDFTLRSVDAVLRREFGATLTDEGVHVFAPFVGVGMWINRLLTQSNSEGDPFIADADLDRKFSEGTCELHANEIVLLAYYVATVNIEEAYRSRSERYKPFGDIALTDTFQRTLQLPGMGFTHAQNRSEWPVQVIIGNPPWGAGQRSSGDDNPYASYPLLEQRVRRTYGKWHKHLTGRGGGKSAGNLYVQAIRWATDRLADAQGNPSRPGVIAFVHPNSLTTAPSLAGMRAALRNEFTSIYVVDLKGDATAVTDRHEEGAPVFGQGTRNGTQITVLVRNPAKQKSAHATLRYTAAPAAATVEQKFQWLNKLGDASSGELAEVPVNYTHDWIDLTNGAFNGLMPLYAIKQKDGPTALVEQVLGPITNLDAYVYSFSKNTLIAKINVLINTYENARNEVMNGVDFAEATANNQLGDIKWTDRLKASLRKCEHITFDESRIRQVLYRPFSKRWLYEDPRILASVKKVSLVFPTERIQSAQYEAAEALLVSGAANMTFQALATDTMFDIATIAGSRQTRGLRSCLSRSVDHSHRRNT